jgi:hypothetical protein
MKKFLTLSMAAVATVAIISPARADIYDANVYCQVVGIRTGQLALRHQENGAAFAGLNNGDRVQAIGGSYIQGLSWYTVKVMKGSNSRLNGKEGVVNAKYLTCDWYSFEGKFIRRDEAKAR